jgi:uncharacterized protein (TIGR03067 family)
VLCGLEGKTNEEAGRLLGCPRETVATRLARARERLRLWLTRRGLALSALVLAGELSPSLAASVSAPLASSTIQAGLAFAAGSMTTTSVSATVLSLTEGVLQTMFLYKLRMILVVLLALTISGAGVGLFLIRAGQPEQQKAEKTLDDGKAILGTWKLVSAKKDGKEPKDADEVKNLLWVISADKIIVKHPNGDRVSSYKLGPDKKPKTFDLTAPKEGQFQGIYILDKDTLKLCMSGPGQERPTEFDAKGAFQFELRRVVKKKD